MSLSGAFRSIIRPLSSSSRRILPLSLPRIEPPLAVAAGGGIHPSLLFIPQWISSSKLHLSTSTGGLVIGSLSGVRYPKRRPGTKPRRKRASLKPPGPYAWVRYVPGEPIPRSRPNEGSAKGRKRKKRIAQRKAFILSEKKNRKALWQEARKKKANERIERKMAAVAREKVWAEQLNELQKLEAEKKAAMN